MAEKKAESIIPSSTVLLGRDGPNGIEVFMVVRHHQIDFASGALVFPGGKVEPEDMALQMRRLSTGCESLDDAALGFRVAAIREVYEESGFLLARKIDEENVIGGKALSSLSHYREKLINGEVGFADFLKQEKLILACDLLTLYAHWVTPVGMPKRFDTLFFITKVPAGQKGVHDGHESVDSVWITPQKALSDASSGEKTVIFPTRMNLVKLEKYPIMDDVISAAAKKSPLTVLPVVKEQDGILYLCIPEEAGYGITQEPLSMFKGHEKPI